MSSQDYEILLKVRADLQQALGKIGDLDKGIRSIGTTAKEVAGIVGIGFGVHEIVDFAKSILDAQARMVDLSAQTGVSVENLSALQFAAHKAGVDTDTLAQSLSRLAVEAAKQNPAFAAMGISVKDSSGHLKDTSTLLGEVAAKFATYKDGPEKAALANAIFGKSGYGLIQMLDQLGTQGLDQVKEKARQAGALLGGEAAQRAKDFADSLDGLKTSARNAVADGIDAMLPEMQQLVDLAKDPQAQEGLRAIGEGIGTIGIEAGKGIIALGEFIKDARALVGFKLDNNIDASASPDVQQALIDQKQKMLDALDADLAARGGSVLTRGFRANITAAQQGAGAALDNLGNPVGLALDIAGTLSAAGASTEKLKAARDKLAAEIAADKAQLENAKAKDFMATHFEHGTPMVPGDVNGKATAPLVGTGAGAAAATDNAKAAAAALAHLQDQLASLRTQGLDPTATAWAKYNQTVDKAVADAKTAGNSTEANARLNAIVVEAARIRDAELDKIAQQDRDAYEQLLKTISTPAEAKLQDAIAQIAQLNTLLGKGVISAQEYHDAIQKIGENIGMPSPEYRDPTQRHGGSDAYAQLAGNVQAGQDLDQWRQNEINRAKDLQNEEAYQARLVEIDKEYAQKRAVIEQARQTLTLNATSEFFGNLAQLSSSGNKRLAEIGKAAAIAQALINTYESATKAYDSLASIPYIGPALGIAAAAAAIAAGLANVAQIRAQPTGGYSGGGYTGPGGKHEPAGVVHRGEIVWSQENIARVGGVHVAEAMRLGLPGYADGGVVSDPWLDYMRSVPGVPVDPRHAAVNDEIAAEVQRIGKQSASESAGGNGSHPEFHATFEVDGEPIAKAVFKTRAAEKGVVDIAGNHPTKIRGKWGS